MVPAVATAIYLSNLSSFMVRVVPAKRLCCCGWRYFACAAAQQHAHYNLNHPKGAFTMTFSCKSFFITVNYIYYPIYQQELITQA